jgi:hypothetical protein
LAQPEAPSAAEGEALRIEGERNGATPNRNWQTPYLQYLYRGELPLDKAEARRLARRAKSFVLLGDEKELYHRSPSGILQRCISITEGQELLQEIHSGACGHHAAPRALVGNAFRQGFYWPTAMADATRIVRSCQGCQFYARQTHLPAQALQTIPITWSCAVWGLVPCRRHLGATPAGCRSIPRAVAMPSHAERVTAPRLQALLHPRQNQRLKGRTAMQVACNCTTGVHPFDFVASSMEAQAHTSCNRRAGYYVQETAPPLALMPRLLDCGTGAATRGNSAHGPTMPIEHIDHGSVSRGRRRDV